MGVGEKSIIKVTQLGFNLNFLFELSLATNSDYIYHMFNEVEAAYKMFITNYHLPFTISNNSKYQERILEIAIPYSDDTVAFSKSVFFALNVVFMEIFVLHIL